MISGTTAIAPDGPMTFTVQDHLAHTWRDELVGFNLPAPFEPDNWPAVQDYRGRLQPSQITEEQGRRRLFFVVDELPAGDRLVYALAGGKGEPWPDPFEVECSDGTVTLGNGRTALRVPASCEELGAFPAPVLGVRRGDGPWLGAGRLRLPDALVPKSVVSELVERGPLWMTWRLTYRCQGGQRYTVELKLFADRDHVEITEHSELCRDSHWELSLSSGLNPDHFWTHRDDLRPLDFAAAAAQPNLGAVQMPVYSGIWVPDDYYYVAVMNRAAEAGTAVAAAGVRGGSWDYPYANQIDLERTTDGDAFLRLSIRAGHRSWLLMAVDRDGLLNTQPRQDNPVHRVVKQYETPLDKVKDWTLAWDDAAPTERPFSIATPEQLARAQRVAQDYEPLRDYVASLDPDLPGDYTYYHAGTHRVFTPDHRNDPAALFVATEEPGERRKQAEFLKDVVLTGLASRREAMLDGMGHIDHDCASINLGRGLRPWAALYDLAASESVFSDAEDRLVKATFAFFGYKIFDPDFWPADHLTFRDDHPISAHRTHWFPDRQSDWAMYNIDNIPHNFHGDLWSAAGCIALTFPGHPCSRQWVERTLEWWESELTWWVFPEGAWLESSTYTLNSLKDYLIYCRMLSNRRVRDYFTDERLQNAFRCVAEMLGPDDRRIGGRSLPVIGDGGYPNGFCYVLGWMAGLCERDEPFARQMSHAWKTTGRYLTEPGRFGLNFCDLLFLDPHIPGDSPAPLPSKRYPGLGAVLRHAQGTPEEIYCFIKGGIIYSHFHEPEGTFQLWWDALPICDEYGLQYGSGVNGVSTSAPSCHNCIEIPGETAAYNKGEITTFHALPALDFVVVDAPEQLAYLAEGQWIWGYKGEMGPAGWHKRMFLLVKPHYLYVYDELTGPYPSIYHLNVKADDYSQQGNQVHFDGRYETDLEFAMLDLGERTIQHAEFDLVPNPNLAWQAPPRFFHQRQISVPSAPYENYASVLVPHARELPASVESDPETGGARLQIGERVEKAVLSPRPRTFETSDFVFAGQAGAVGATADGIVLRLAEGYRIGVPGRLTIEGAGPLNAELTDDGVVRIQTDGGARWLTLRDLPVREATCDGEPVAVEASDGAATIYVPAGPHTIECRS